MVTFLHLYYAKKLNKPINEVCLLGRLTVEIMTFDKQRHYLENAIYNNNFKVL